MKVIYLIGALNNPNVPIFGNKLRTLGFNVFDDWYGAGEFADIAWQQYEEGRGHTYEEALQGYAAYHVWEYDKFHLDRADLGVLLYPAGKDCHVELGYLVGQGKPTYILIDKVPEKWGVMARFANEIYFDETILLRKLIEDHGNNS